MNVKDLTQQREWLVWALALSREQRRRRGIRLRSVELWNRLHAVDHLLRLQETASDDNRGPIDTRLR